MVRIVAIALMLALALPAPAIAQEEPEGGAVARVFHCGLVKAYTPPEGTKDGVPFHETAGSTTVGEKTLTIAAGTKLGHPARPAEGEAHCVDGRLNASGELIHYMGLGFPPTCQSGPIGRYEAATATEDGVLQFAFSSSPPFTADSWVFRIPAGTVLPADASSGRYCFVYELDSSGRAIFTRIMPEATQGSEPSGQQPGGGGTGRTGPARVPQLPSTSTR